MPLVALVVAGCSRAASRPQSGAVLFGRVSGGQFPGRDEFVERGPARLVVKVVVDANC
jgi:hypothetical protein